MSLVGYTQGRFDVVHHGHVMTLSMLKRWLGGGKLIVGVATDEFCKLWKGEDPVLNWHERATVIRHLNMVDAVIPYDCQDVQYVYDRMGFDVFFCSDELYDREVVRYGNRPWQTVYFPRTPGISSSQIKASHG